MTIGYVKQAKKSVAGLSRTLKPDAEINHAPTIHTVWSMLKLVYLYARY
jgi:hypothetical protein